MDTMIRYHRMKGATPLGGRHRSRGHRYADRGGRQLQAQGTSGTILGRDEFANACGSGRSNPAPPSRGRCVASARPPTGFRRRGGANQGYFTMDSHMSKGVVETFVAVRRGSFTAASAW